MAFVRWIAGGLIGGLIGAMIWAAIGYAANAEIGWIAWGIGFLVGAGVRAAAPETGGPAPGVVAVLLSAVSILIGKFAVAYLLVAHHFGEIEIKYTIDDPKTMIAVTADQVEEEFKQANRKVTPALEPNPDLAEDVPLEQTYPKEVWAEAAKRWNALPQDQKDQQIKAHEENTNVLIKEAAGEMQASARSEVFANAFGPYDLLWFGLAAFTAFRIGSGGSSEE